MPSGLGKANVINSFNLARFSRTALSKQSLMSKTKLISEIFHFDNPTELTGGLSTWRKRKTQVHSLQDPACVHWPCRRGPRALPWGKRLGTLSTAAQTSLREKTRPSYSKSRLWSRGRAVAPSPSASACALSSASLPGFFPVSTFLTHRYTVRKCNSGNGFDFSAASDLNKTKQCQGKL